MRRRIVRWGLVLGCLVLWLAGGVAGASATATSSTWDPVEQSPTTTTTPNNTTAPAPSELPLTANRPPAAPARPRAARTPTLPVTGAGVTETAVIGAAFLGAGALVLAARRRASAP